MNVTKRCRHGEMTYRVNDMFIGRSFDLYGEFSEGEVELFRHLVRPGQTVLDVGANIGAHTVPLAQMVGPRGRVLAFEPQRTVYYLLCANVVHNNMESTVHCYHAALGEARGEIAVPELSPDAVQNFGGLSLANSAWTEGDKVPVLRIDDLALTACDLIKVDVEGMEREVLVGASETIRRFRPLLYVEDDRQEKSAALRGLLSSLGYDFYWHAPRLFNPNNFFKNSQDVFDNIASVNLYAHHSQTASPAKPESFGLQRLSGPSVADEMAARPASAGPAVGVSAVAPVDPTPSDAQFDLPAPAQEALNVGLALYQQGRLDEAMVAFRRAADIKPDLAHAYNNMGLVEAALGRYQEAIAGYRRAIALKPTFAEAHNNLALVLRQTGQLDAAIESCRQATRVAPESPQAHSNFGCFLQEAERFDEAIEALTAALRLDSRYPQALNNLGICQWRLGRYEEATASYRRAIEVAPEGAEAYNNLGSALRDQGELDEALACYERAIEIKPDYAAPHWNRSLIWLLKGEFARGWPEYEWRWGLSTFQRRQYAQPAWDGASPEGKTVLLIAEQGLGDTLQFIRYAPLLAARGARVVAEVHRPLRRLIKSCAGVDKVIVQGETPPPFDTHTTLMSLPGLFNTTPESIPAQVPYLAADAGLVEQWRDEIRALPGFKIGIAWKGSPQNGQDRERSLPLAMFEQLASVPEVTLVSLQKGVGSEQIAQVAERFTVVDFAARLDEMSGPFMDTAAVMTHLDLVITCDSALAHLAGAMGVPVWVALMKTPDWRWLLHGEESRWYPTMRLFRQARRGEWEDVFNRMAAVLAERVSGSPLVPTAGRSR